MKRLPVLIKNIQQASNHSFTILWSDGLQHEFRLSQLQQNCPCAKCHDIKLSGKIPVVNSHVRAIQIVNVGRYAMRIQFTEGCSSGIFSFDTLRQLSIAKENI